MAKKAAKRTKKKAKSSGNRKKKPDLLQVLLDAARNHGSESDPEHEVGDLQSILMLVWPCLTKEQQKKVAVTALVDMGMAEWMNPMDLKIGRVRVGKF